MRPECYIAPIECSGKRQARYRLFERKKLLIRAEGHALAVPFASYAFAEDFRVNSFGFTTGAGLNLTYHLDSNWGIETYAGAYYTRLLEFDAPDPYQNISPIFIGYRMGVGVNYRF